MSIAIYDRMQAFDDRGAGLMAATLLVIAVSRWWSRPSSARRVAPSWLIARYGAARSRRPDPAGRRVHLRRRARCWRSSARRAAARRRSCAASRACTGPRAAASRWRRRRGWTRLPGSTCPPHRRRGRIRVPGLRAVPAPDRARQRDDRARPSAAPVNGGAAREQLLDCVHLRGRVMPPARSVGRRTAARGRGARAGARAARAAARRAVCRGGSRRCGGRFRARSTESAARSISRSSSSPTTSRTSCDWPRISSSCRRTLGQADRIEALTSRPDLPWLRETVGPRRGRRRDCCAASIASEASRQIDILAAAFSSPRMRVLRSGDAVRVRIPAREVILASEAPSGLSVHNVLTGTVANVSSDGPSEAAIVQLAVGTRAFWRRSPGTPCIDCGLRKAPNCMPSSSRFHSRYSPLDPRWNGSRLRDRSRRQNRSLVEFQDLALIRLRIERPPGGRAPGQHRSTAPLRWQKIWARFGRTIQRRPG